MFRVKLWEVIPRRGDIGIQSSEGRQERLPDSF